MPPNTSFLRAPSSVGWVRSSGTAKAARTARKSPSVRLGRSFASACSAPDENHRKGAEGHAAPKSKHCTKSFPCWGWGRPARATHPTPHACGAAYAAPRTEPMRRAGALLYLAMPNQWLPEYCPQGGWGWITRAPTTAQSALGASCPWSTLKNCGEPMRSPCLWVMTQAWNTSFPYFEKQ